jgi:hypothetical protein
MEVHFQPDLDEAGWAVLGDRPGERSYFDELARVREMLDRRYDDIESGWVKPVAGEAFFDKLRKREDIVAR